MVLRIWIDLILKFLTFLINSMYYNFYLHYGRFYDPRVPELQVFLHEESFFPSQRFSHPEALDTLVTLGLRQTLGFTGLLDCARSISMLHVSRDPRAVLLSRRLLFCLNAVANKLSGREGRARSADITEFQENTLSGEEELPTYGSENVFPDSFDVHLIVSNLVEDMSMDDFWSDLQAIDWCPVYFDPPVEGLPWLTSDHKVAAPLMVRPLSQMWIISSKLHILDGECSEYLQHKLGWMEPPDAKTLCAQLVGLSKSYSQIKLHHNTELQEQILMIYSQLQKYIVNTDDLAFLKATMVGVNWVWIGDEFVEPNVLAFDSPVKFSPYMYVVPSELSVFQDLLLALGVRRSFDVFDYIHVLRRLQSDVRGSLSADQLNFVQCVLETIADNYSDGSVLEVTDTLLVPDYTGVLVSARDLVYNDAPWMENTPLVGKLFVHSSISYELSNRLGIQPLRSLSLVSKELTKDLPCMDHNKIRELLESYGDYEFLLFDLLELADCCKSRKLHLIYDKREHPQQSLLQHNLGN